jgi:UDP:flavonoid glycosyltransferase YjiC (YdhE family)
MPLERPDGSGARRRRARVDHVGLQRRNCNSFRRFAPIDEVPDRTASTVFALSPLAARRTAALDDRAARGGVAGATIGCTRRGRVEVADHAAEERAAGPDMPGGVAVAWRRAGFFGEAPAYAMGIAMTMRILFSSTRGAGHLQPLVPFAQALVRRGHEVRVAAPEGAAAALAAAGLRHVSFDHPREEELAAVRARLAGLSPEQVNAVVVRKIFAGLDARAALPRLRQAIAQWRPQLVVRGSAELASAVAAAAAGIPHARIAAHNPASEAWILARAAPALDSLRIAAGLAADGGASLRRAPAFTFFPASLDRTADGDGGELPFRVRLPRDAPSSPAAAPPPAWLPRDGRPLLYITFGTMAGGVAGAQAVYRAALAAAASLPVRALLTTGPGIAADALGPIPPNVTVTTFVPQAEVLPHAAALLCHGGSGTVLGALAAGVPMAVAPMFADQPENARAVAAAGAGVAVPTPDAAAITAAVERVLADLGLRAQAHRIAEEMAALPSVDEAVQALLEPLGRSRG